MEKIRSYKLSYLFEVEDHGSRAKKDKMYATGERNGKAKLSDGDVVLMLDYFDSCQKDIEKINSQIEELQAKKIQLKKQMTRRYIADMFDVSVTHCERIIRGESR